MAHMDGLFHCELPHCNAIFKSVNKLNRHLLTHSGEKPFVCTFPGCDKRYTRNDHLTRHYKQHQNLPPTFKCQHDGCNAAFAFSTRLKRHMLLHEKEAVQYPCKHPGCSMVFSKAIKLREHSFEHTGIHPFPCTIDGCTESFKSKRELQRHNSSKHVPRHTCHCGQKFFQFAKLRRHKKDAHPTIYNCEICNYTFSKKHHLDQHMQKHNSNRVIFHCEYPGCNSTCTTKSNLRVHIRTCHGDARPWVCPEDGCGMAFKHKHVLIRHGKTHQERKHKQAPKPVFGMDNLKNLICSNGDIPLTDGEEALIGSLNSQLFSLANQSNESSVA